MGKVFLLMVLSFVVLTVKADDNVKRPDTYNYNRGLEELNNGNQEEALSFFKKELEANPKNGYAYSWIAMIYGSNDEQGRALSAVESALKYLPKKDETFVASAYAIRANVYLELKDTTKALSDFTSAVKAAPKDDNWYEKRAQLYYELGKYDLADADYHQIQKLDKTKVMGYMGIGRNRIAQKQWDEAIEQFNYVQSLYNDYSSAYSFRAEAYMGQEKWAEATDDLITALALDGDNKAFYLMQELKEPALSMMVAKLKIQGAKKPNDSYFHYCAGVISENANDFEKALNFYQEARKRETDVLTLRRISQCYLELSNYEAALSSVNQAIDLDTTDTSLLSHKADILTYKGDYAKAIEIWNGLVDLSPDNTRYYYRRAMTKKLVDDIDGAIDDYTMAITLFPKFPYALALRADLYTQQGKLDLAKADWLQVIDVESEMNDIDRSPYAYQALGNNEKAIALVDSIIASDKDNEGNYYDAACIYSRMKKREKALEYLAIALEKGYRNIENIMTDYDMDFLRDTEEFNQLINKYKKVSPQMSVDVQTKQQEVVSEIPFTKENGVCSVKCKINDLPLYFVFDTGASTVSLSMVEATFMMKNGYLSKKDVVGSSTFMDANGNVSEGTIINLKKVQFGDMNIENVKASVVRNQKAPLLLGQSVLSRIGKIEVDNQKQVVRVRYMK